MASNARLWDLFMVKNAKWYNFCHNFPAWRVEWWGKNDESTWVHNSNTHNSLRKQVMKRFVSFVSLIIDGDKHEHELYLVHCAQALKWLGQSLVTNFFFFFFEEFGYKSGYKQWLQLYSISFSWMWILTNQTLDNIFFIYSLYLQNF